MVQSLREVWFFRCVYLYRNGYNNLQFTCFQLPYCFSVQLFFLMEIPNVLTTDQGKEFHNEVNRLLMKSFQIEHCLTTAYHPQANGLDERFNQTLCNTIAKITGEERDTWDEQIPETVYAYNTSVQV